MKILIAMFQKALFFFSICFLSLNVASSVTANDELRKKFDEALSVWELALYEKTQDLERGNLSQSDFEDIRDDLDHVRIEAREFISQLQPIQSQLTKQLKGLGPIPEQNQTPETEQIVMIRQTLETELSVVSSQIKQAELISPRVDELVGRFNKIERQRFVNEVFSRGPVPISRSLWGEAFELSGTDWEVFFLQLELALNTAGQKIEWEEIIPLWVIVLAAAFVSSLLLRVMRRRYGVQESIVRPDYHKRVLAASLNALRRALIPVTLLTLVTGTLVWGKILDPEIEQMVEAIILGLLFITIAEAITKATLFPVRSSWRVLAMAIPAAQQVRIIAIIIAFIFSIDLLIRVVNEIVPASASQHLLGSFFTATAMAVLVILLHRKSLWKLAGEVPEEISRVSRLWSRFRKVIVAFMSIMIAAAFIGFIPMAHFAVFNLVATLELFLLLLLIHVIVHEVAHYELSGKADIGRSLRNILSLDDDGADRLGFWIVLCVGCALVVLGVIGILLIWGMSGQRLLGIIQAGLTGFEIGEVRISFIDIAVAGMLFIGMLALTKVFAKLLDERLLPKTKLDAGVRDAIKASVGYAGLGLAVLIGVSAAGLDLSNIAIVAGALSVGIGFGLQSIVNNFVSGLILIFERPIKQGDWVVVGNEEGHVKKIKVRATEIETFDRASVIIPNSDLISGTMKNWTHKSKLGRLELRIGVSYDVDEEKVRDILTKIATEHSGVLPRPEPYVLFMDFGASSLDFELRCFLKDIENKMSIASDLRFSIRKAFQEAGIEIPFPQQDVYIKQIPSGVKSIDEFEKEDEVRAEDPETEKSTEEKNIDKKPE
ncbi:hypothetical protein WH96_16345 [Kiloniella spongiae]|uniref:Uncharacterized protein n=1 Tax=Kiloniella spongiae TaxID=1489064 RepID=A0A0H2MAR5_9PROT|nr:DUF3772 domain-containing protein [Kiloniella spongiae]KLN59619.1 hypothetical protein WH96_16345 [Kiloniella spongiae]